MKRLERLLSMALVLAARRRLRAADLAERFSISERTVYRDVRALQAAGFPVEGNAGDGYRVSQSAYLRPLALTESEAVALGMGARLLAASADAPLREQISSASAKLEAVLGPSARQRLRRHQGEVYVSRTARRAGGPLGRLLAALDAREVLEIKYEPDSEGPPTVRQVEPLGFVRLESAWLLVAYCRLRKDARAFRVDQITRLRATGETYTPRPGFSFGEVIERERAKRPGS
jgi:predicted DNA-binding transcriptional regulator YafY